MTKDEMIELAKQAGWQYAHGESGYEALWAFGKLVAEKEREACAVIVETPISGEQDDITMEAKDRVAKAIRAREQK